MEPEYEKLLQPLILVFSPKGNREMSGERYFFKINICCSVSVRCMTVSPSRTDTSRALRSYEVSTECLLPHRFRDGKNTPQPYLPNCAVRSVQRVWQSITTRRLYYHAQTLPLLSR